MLSGHTEKMPDRPPSAKNNLWDMRNPVTLNLPGFWDLSSQGYMTTYWLTGRKPELLNDIDNLW